MLTYKKLEPLLRRAIEILGKMALRRRARMAPAVVRELEDELFEVFEALNDEQTKAHERLPGSRVLTNEKRDNDGTS